ncbi:acetyl-CoA carboxylase biotin carboxylase subunit [Prosthecochloris sp. N3]|uniref:Biotin carboxylase n=1 Tax=Prosthecochloris ethylica TaxID=2743976 RepID=A0ABR9XQP9_9CHLB|nr:MULTISPECIES: acetyl-CoA carboxylase biotin carboxylase subunit [Prosthecochloris]MEC9486124.1 acetyl-CoA carboxylase biotin carboxylase subunit [Prosthecochloris sp.]MBF0586436.1 acetyl-CoA carboxylase biotin carboxylase subunit [Prosthecochloris ethylica]MBF0636346.1 acetyl-CoA carboxylase biotin carboxylase subunit [Prosthecochloris ethylica]NUK47520.1 acetyl-CoA carboxylase biotin carboxylase subunit [Prosthecochloris ethylica]RNA65771.1 acetyl-CoA carboxylase biotin carboxylase subunit
MFKKILIANRGEIALRVMQSCRELGIGTIAVYSTADRNSLHVKYADEAVCIGPAPGKDSYLNIPRIIAAAEITNADAIHPGYGFLAENADFAEVCTSSGIKFIGPTAEMIRKMGDKNSAKETMIAAGVPVIPGSDGLIRDAAHALKTAEDIGYPVIIKPTAGGGGKGMRVVHESSMLEKSLVASQNEAHQAFGNSGVYIEKFVDRPRHVEIQILADQHGNALHLGERDCTIQRRHQKLIEETPSPAVDEQLREKMGAAAVAAAQAISYEGAGTIEFLLDNSGHFYFMEMNTRIQVEHPVTEERYDVDLVKEQILVAAGGSLAGKNYLPKGHSIECRINAEDPEHGFRPSPGELKVFHTPGGHGVRVDSHGYASYQIPPHYDSMIGKLIVTADTRDEAIARMQRALDEFIVAGIKTTIPFHKQLLKTKEFRSGSFDTHFLDSFTFIPDNE